MTNQLDWTAAQAPANSGQQHVEQVFRGSKDGEWLRRWRLHQWMDSKVRVRAFYYLLDMSLLQYLHRKA